jgi:hypothetical protein
MNSTARAGWRQQQDAIRQIDRLFQVVRHQHRGGPGLDEDLLQLLAHEQRHLVVQRRERLVQKQDFGIDHQCAHDRDQLLLPAGHLVRIEIEIDLDVEVGDDPLDANDAFGLRHAHYFQRIGDIVEGAKPGKHGFAIVLEHVAELDLVERLAVEQDFTGIDWKQPGDHVDQRALAAAVRPEYRHQLAARDIEIEIIVDRGVGEALAQAADRDMRRGPRCGGPRILG